VLDEEGAPVGDLPRLTGISKEAVSMSLGFLEKRGDVLVEHDPAAARGKAVRLTPRGRQSQDSSRHLVASSSASPAPPGCNYPDAWRAAVPPPDTLLHRPTVLHRGGFPDGS